MAGLYTISSTFFVNLLNRLGVKPPPHEGFALINTVQPVSVVDQDIVLNVTSAPTIFGTPFTSGRVAVPAANTILCDTGPLAAGNWHFLVTVGILETTNFSEVLLQHRNAANAADIWNMMFPTGASVAEIYNTFEFAKSMALNERMRITNLQVGSAGSVYYANIFASQIS